MSKSDLTTCSFYVYTFFSHNKTFKQELKDVGYISVITDCDGGLFNIKICVQGCRNYLVDCMRQQIMSWNFTHFSLASLWKWCNGVKLYTLNVFIFNYKLNKSK